MGYEKIKEPANGDKITVNADFSLNVPDTPVIPYIEGDGIGADVSPAMLKVVDASIKKRTKGDVKSNGWKSSVVKATRVYGENTWLPEETLEALKSHVVSIKGPLTTPVGGGIRSLNVALRQELDLFSCIRPVRWFKGVPSPVKSLKRLTWLFSVKTRKISMRASNGRRVVPKPPS